MSDETHAIVIDGLSDEQIDALLYGTGYASKTDDLIDFAEADRDSGSVSIGGDISALLDKIDELAEHNLCPVDEEIMDSVWYDLHDAYIDVKRF